MVLKRFRFVTLRCSVPRDVNRYAAVKGELRYDLRKRPTNTGQPFSRPVLESGTAFKTVYLSKAPKAMTHERMAEVLNAHERQMRIELQLSGRLVRKVTRIASGSEGDCKLLMSWEILGSKKTKAWRKQQC